MGSASEVVQRGGRIQVVETVAALRTRIERKPPEKVLTRLTLQRPSNQGPVSLQLIASHDQIQILCTAYKDLP